jgi:hypothetical protein
MLQNENPEIKSRERIQDSENEKRKADFDFLKAHLRSELGPDACEMIDKAANGHGGLCYITVYMSDSFKTAEQKLEVVRWTNTYFVGLGKVFGSYRRENTSDTGAQHHIFTLSRYGEILAEKKPNDIPAPGEIGVKFA